jgi:hypothetical protein
MTTVLLKMAHGLGDVTQFSVVLKHIRKYRQDWVVDCRVGRGKHTALTGLCRRVFHDQEPDPPGPYDKVIDLPWWENYNSYSDRPCSKITNCLQEIFQIEYDASLGRYQVAVSEKARHKAEVYLVSIGATKRGDKYGAVILHANGNTSSSRKDLNYWQAQQILSHVQAADRIPIVFDWDQRSPWPDGKNIFNPGCGEKDLWGGFGSGDAETIAALISQVECYIGIDSGPGKIASATETPSMICWTGHHPMQFHDPAPNTLHLVPEMHWSMAPCGGNARATDYFKQHYLYRTYQGEHGLVEAVRTWLTERLGKGTTMVTYRTPFVVPPGIGDSIWALLKIQSIAAGQKVDLIVSGDHRQEIDRRAVPFLERFDFVESVKVADIPILHDKDNPADTQGRYNYVSDGLHDGFHFLIPNRTLEAGRRLETWLPEYKIDWDVMDHFDYGDRTKREDELSAAPFAVFYLGPESGHCDEGHNWGWLWEPKHWAELAVGLQAKGLKIVVTGASYDRSFWERYVRQGFEERGVKAIDWIGETPIEETLGILLQAKCLISYQCGLGIVAHYLGVPVAMWWRPEGKSAHPRHHISFSEQMATAWTNPAPEYQRRYLPLIYQRETPADILRAIDERGWIA